MRTVLGRELRHRHHLLGRRAADDADVCEVRLVKRREHRDREDLRAVRTELVRRHAGGLNHRLRTDGMDRHKIDAELAARTDRTFDRARNVVELEVEEDLLAEILHRLDDVRTLSREQLQANLIETDGFANRLDLLHRLFTSLNIQRNNQFRHGKQSPFVEIIANIHSALTVKVTSDTSPSAVEQTTECLPSPKSRTKGSSPVVSATAAPSTNHHSRLDDELPIT